MTYTRLILSIKLVILLFLAYTCHSKHNCNHNELFKNFTPTIERRAENPDPHRRLQVTNTRQIKIVFDGSNISGATAEQVDFIINKMAPVSVEFFRQRLKIISIDTILKFGDDKCYQVI